MVLKKKKKQWSLLGDLGTTEEQVWTRHLEWINVLLQDLNHVYFSVFSVICDILYLFLLKHILIIKIYVNLGNFLWVLYFGFPWWLRQERIHLQCKRLRFDPWVRKIPWRKEWLPTPVFLPGEFHEQGSLVGYCPWGHRELDMTECYISHF